MHALTTQISSAPQPLPPHLLGRPSLKATETKILKPAQQSGIFPSEFTKSFVTTDKHDIQAEQSSN